MVAATALPDHDLSPLIATLGLPQAGEGADLAPVGQVRWRSSVATASHAMQETDGNETLLFDGETTRLAIAFDYGLTDRLQVGLELPYLWHESGGLDTVVDTWHDWFGFPDGLRRFVPQDQLDFRYQDGGIDRLNLQSNERGVGDLRLLAAWQLQQSAHAASALRISLQLPTGSSDTLTGSGAAALSIGFAADRSSLFDRPALSGFYRAHLLLRGNPDRVGERARRAIGVVSGGVSARVNSRLDLTLQAAVRSAAYDSELRVLGDTAVLLNVGGTISLSESLRLAVAVGEDVRVKTAPDVTFALTLHYAPKAR